MDKKELRESLAEIETSIKYFEWVIDNFERHVHEARAEIAQAQLRLEGIKKLRDVAPEKLEDLKRRKMKLNRDLQILVHNPKLDQIAKLRKKIEFLEKKK